MSGYEQFLTMDRAQLIDAIEKAHRDDVAALLYAELRHRDLAEQTDLMLTYTRRMLWLTGAVTILTIINVVLVAYTITH